MTRRRAIAYGILFAAETTLWLYTHSERAQVGRVFDDIDEMAFLVCRGGWPYVHANKTKAALRRAFSYLDATVKSDISRCDGIHRVGAPPRPRAARRLPAHRLAEPLSQDAGGTRSVASAADGTEAVPTNLGCDFRLLVK